MSRKKINLIKKFSYGNTITKDKSQEFSWDLLIINSFWIVQLKTYPQMLSISSNFSLNGMISSHICSTRLLWFSKDTK